MNISNNKECLNCKWQTGCIDNWEGNPQIGLTGCCKYEKIENKESKKK